MNYWLHPETQEDLREAAEFYREQAGTALSQSFLVEFEHCVGLLLQYPRLGAIWPVSYTHLTLPTNREV